MTINLHRLDNFFNFFFSYQLNVLFLNIGSFIQVLPLVILDF